MGASIARMPHETRNLHSSKVSAASLRGSTTTRSTVPGSRSRVREAAVAPLISSITQPGRACRSLIKLASSTSNAITLDWFCIGFSGIETWWSVDKSDWVIMFPPLLALSADRSPRLGFLLLRRKQARLPKPFPPTTPRGVGATGECPTGWRCPFLLPLLCFAAPLRPLPCKGDRPVAVCGNVLATLSSHLSEGSLSMAAARERRPFPPAGPLLLQQADRHFLIGSATAKLAQSSTGLLESYSRPSPGPYRRLVR